MHMERPPGEAQLLGRPTVSVSDRLPAASVSGPPLCVPGSPAPASLGPLSSALGQV